MSDGRYIEIDTPKGVFSVWTRKLGEHPTKKLLLLHGGPGATHEGFEIFEQYLPSAGIEDASRPQAPVAWSIR